MATQRRVLQGMLLDDEPRFTLDDLCRHCDLHAEAIIEWVEEGLLEPLGQEPGEWRFPGHSLSRIQAALRLQQDLGVNLAGTAIVLEMQEEIRALRRRVRLLEKQLFADE